jgi:uncharacterized membrane protein YkoI
MERITTHKRWVVGVGAAALLLLGGLAAGPIASMAQGDPDASLTEGEAIQIAIDEFPGTTSISVDLEEEDGRAVYEINLSNGYEVEVDGDSGRILETEASDDNSDDVDDNRDDDRDDDRDDANDDSAVAGTIDDGADLLPQAAITLEQAIAAAQDAADGAVGEVDLEYDGDRLVFNVDIGNSDVKVDAGDGSIVRVENDD